MNELLDILHLTMIAYGITTLLLLLVALFNTRLKGNRKKILDIFNTTALGLSLIITICTICDYVINGQVPYIVGFEGAGTAHILFLLLQSTTPILFFISRFRQSVRITLLVVISSNLLFIFNTFMVQTSLYRDTLPLSSGTQGAFILLIIVISMLLIAIVNLRKENG